MHVLQFFYIILASLVCPTHFFLFACLFILICTFLLHLLVNLDVGLFILVIFLKELTLFIDSLYFSLCFYFIDLSLQCYYFLLPISLAVPRFWYQDFSYVVKFLVWDIMETFFYLDTQCYEVSS